MTRARAKELLPVIQAFAEGKAIQVRISERSGWSDLNAEHREHVYWDGSEYRIKDEPREWWLGQCPQHRPVAKVFLVKPDKQCDDCEIIHVREVLE